MTEELSRNLNDVTNDLNNQYNQVLNGTHSIENFSGRVIQSINQFISDPQNEEKIGYNNVESLNNLLINLSTLVSEFRRERELGNDDSAAKFQKKLMLVCDQIINRLQSLPDKEGIYLSKVIVESKKHKEEKEEENLKEYLETIEREPETEDPIKIDPKKTLAKRYTFDQEAVLLDSPDDGNLTYKQLKKRYTGDIQGIIDLLIKDFLNVQDRRCLIVTASFGMGKTSLVRMFASECAKNYLYKNKDGARMYETSEYIPIPLFINKLTDVNLDSDLETKVAPNDEARQRNILLLLDGWDEFPDYFPDNVEERRNGIKNKILEYMNKYPNMKVIITTRDAKDRSLNDMPKRAYLRLLPFTTQQVNNLFKEYGIGYDDIISQQGAYRLSPEEITKPLFTWMFSQMHASGSQLEVKFSDEWSGDIRQSLIYTLFFHHIVKGKYTSPPPPGYDELFALEKITLRKIAAIKQKHQTQNIPEKSTTEMVIEELKKLEEKQSDKILSAFNNVLLRCYFTDIIQSQQLSFMHITFMHYLLAEYYIESLIENKMHRLNIGVPSEQTISFFNGLIDLIAYANEKKHLSDSNDETDDDPIVKFIEKDDTCLLRSFNVSYKNNLPKFIKKLTENARSSFNNDCIIFFNDNAIVKEINEEIRKERTEDEPKDNFWTLVKDITSSDYACLWIHRWIPLYILNKLTKDKADKTQLKDLIKYSSNSIPSLLKNLREADLTDVDLSGANLSGADLSGAYLRNAVLSGADLTEAVLSATDLTEADLTGAILRKLTNPLRKRIILSGAKLSGADLTEADLSEADLSTADLTKADLSGANLSGADLTYADLSLSLLKDCSSYNGLKCKDADFNHAIIDDPKLIEYLKNQNPKNKDNIHLLN